MSDKTYEECTKFPERLIYNPTQKKDAIYKNMPQPIKSLLLITEGWLVGSSVDLLSGDNMTHLIEDYDVIVEDSELFQRGVQYLIGLGHQISVNSFGGLKFTFEDYPRVDMWMSNPSHFFINRRKNASPIFSLKQMMLLRAE